MSSTILSLPVKSVSQCVLTCLGLFGFSHLCFLLTCQVSLLSLSYFDGFFFFGGGEGGGGRLLFRFSCFCCFCCVVLKNTFYLFCFLGHKRPTFLNSMFSCLYFLVILKKKNLKMKMLDIFLLKSINKYCKMLKVCIEITEILLENKSSSYMN